MHSHFSTKKLIVLSVGLHAALLVAPIRQTLTQNWQAAPTSSGINVVLQAVSRPVPVSAPIPTPKALPTKEAKTTKPVQTSSAAVPAGPALAAAPVELDESAFKHYIHPRYPRIAMIQGIEGSVRLELWANEQGQVARAEVIESSGYPVLDEAALTAAKKWVFNQPISAQTKLSKRITFRIEN